MKKAAAIGLLLAMAFGTTQLFAESEEAAVAPVAVLSEAEALATWEKAYEVFSHPRCVNCHVPEDNRPRWSGPSYGEGWQYHGMYIHAGEDRFGTETMACNTCHGPQNSEVPHGPPGSAVWMLAPVEMVWWEKSSQEICEQIKDPERNGGRTLEDVADHVSHDELVLWGWEPGPGREPAPYSAAELSAFIAGWAAAGAPCPTP